MSAILCGVLEMVGGLYEGWQNFKLLKKRERIKSEIARCEDSEEVLNYLVQAREAQNQMRDVLKFWTVYAVLVIFELYLEIFVFWVPFYYSVKFFLLVWIMTAKGATAVFDHVVGPQLDRHAVYIDNVAFPAAQALVLSGQKSFLNAFVGVSTLGASDTQLVDLQDHLEGLQRKIDNEQNRRAAAALDSDDDARAGAVDDDTAAILVPPPHDKSRETAEVGMLWSLGGSAAGVLASVLSLARSDKGIAKGIDAGDASPTSVPHRALKCKIKLTSVDTGSGSSVTQEDCASYGAAAVSAGRGLRAGSSGWVKSAFDGVLGLTAGTRDVLLGSSASLQSLERESKSAESEVLEEDPDIVHNYGSSNNSDAREEKQNRRGESLASREKAAKVTTEKTRKLQKQKQQKQKTTKATATPSPRSRDAVDPLAKYKVGFDHLSDLDDSDDSIRALKPVLGPVTRSQARRK